jgi:3-methyladenine DNA glycosylase AlkD
MNLHKVLKTLEDMADPDKIIIKQEKFGIMANNALGVYQKDLKDLAKKIGRNDKLALELFDSGIYEARILCSKIYNPNSITEELMEKWVLSFENWEICDSFCMGFFAKSEYALAKANEWSKNKSEFVKRAGFVIMACYGFVNKNADNAIFEQFLPIIEREATDERLYVKKAVNWALRNIGKRNIDLNTLAISVTNRIANIESKSAKWIANNALRELENSNINLLDYPRHMYRKHG